MRYLWSFAVLALASVVVHADHDMKKEGGQRKEHTPQEMAEKMVQHMEKGLDLSADQKQKVSEIIKASIPEMTELKKKIQKIERQTNEKIRVLLDEEQKEKFDMMRARQNMMMGGHGRMGGMGGHGKMGGQGKMGGHGKMGGEGEGDEAQEPATGEHPGD